MDSTSKFLRGNGENEDQDDTIQSDEEDDIEDQEDSVEPQIDQIIENDSENDQSGMKLDSPTFNPAAEAEADAKALQELIEYWDT